VSDVLNTLQWREAYQILYPYNFRTGETSAEIDDDADNGREGTVLDLASVRTEGTFCLT
jgi:hypothetical protein